MVTAPRTSLAKATHSWRADRARSEPWKVVPTPAVPEIAAVVTTSSTSTMVARAMTARIPDHEAMRAAESLEAIPPLPLFDPVAPADTLMRGSLSCTSVMSVADESTRGSFV